METFIEDLLEDICSDIREVSTRVNNTLLTICRLLPSSSNVFGSNRQHEVLQLTLRNKEVYALDITAAQYGWPVPATMSWDSFMKERVEIVKGTRKFGETGQALRNEAAATTHQDYWNHYKVMDEMKQRFNMLLRQWQAQQGNDTSSLKDILRLPEEKFKRKQASLIQFMNVNFTAFSLKFCKDKAAATAASIKAKTQTSNNVAPTTGHEEIEQGLWSPTP
ncbi:MAG: hypothetical protein Q9226_000251 [Calogaya cf. arnoldii]